MERGAVFETTNRDRVMQRGNMVWQTHQLNMPAPLRAVACYGSNQTIQILLTTLHVCGREPSQKGGMDFFLCHYRSLPTHRA